MATADPGTLPDKATWYLVTNLPSRAARVRRTARTRPGAHVADIVRPYGIRHWIEQSSKQDKDDLGWADFQVRSDVAICRHQALVNYAFSFCWVAWFAEHPPQRDAAARPGGGERGAEPRPRRRPGRGRCARYAPGFPLDRAAALVAGMVQGAPPPQLQALISAVAAGCGLHLYIST